MGTQFSTLWFVNDYGGSDFLRDYCYKSLEVALLSRKITFRLATFLTEFIHTFNFLSLNSLGNIYYQTRNMNRTQWTSLTLKVSTSTSLNWKYLVGKLPNWPFTAKLRYLKLYLRHCCLSHNYTTWHGFAMKNENFVVLFRNIYLSRENCSFVYLLLKNIGKC